MSNQARISARRARKFIASAVVLLIFLFPIAVNARWLAGMVSMRDKRTTFSKQEIQAMRGEDCQEDLSELKPFQQPLVTITFDDGWESVYSSGLSVLERYCVKTTQYILGDHFKDANYLSEAQVRSLLQSGHEVASHTMSHPNLTTLSHESLIWELQESRRRLEAKFGRIQDVASPLGAYDERVLDVAKQYYRSHRNTAADPASIGDEDINTRENYDQYQIIAYTVRQDTTLEDIEKLVAYTKKRNGWLVLNYHQVDGSDAYYAVSKTALAQHLQIIRRYNVRIPVMGEVLSAIERQER